LDAKIKSLLIAALVGGAATIGSEQLGKLQWMQDHPQAWYLEAGALALLAYFVRKKNFNAALSLVAAGGVMAVQGYRHQGGAAAAPAMGGGATPQAMPQGAPAPQQLPAPANGNPGVVPPKQYPPLASQSGEVPQEDQGVVGTITDWLKDNLPLGESPLQASPDNAGALLRRLNGGAGAMLRRTAMGLGRKTY
jgi:hypothetical protein